ncbi:MAG TPA: DUF1579 domain-containing protein [Trueperaceae bacterium]
MNESEPMPTAQPFEPGPEHAWLQRLVGEWVMEAEAAGHPSFTGSETVRPLGQAWIVAEGSFQAEGREPDSSLMMLGFDPEKKRFVGTWAGSALAYLWVYEGQFGDSEKILNLDCMGPSMRGDGKLLPYRDVIEWVSEDERLLRGLVRDADGSWQQFMVTRYRRRGAEGRSGDQV